MTDRSKSKTTKALGEKAVKASRKNKKPLAQPLALHDIQKPIPKKRAVAAVPVKQPANRWQRVRAVMDSTEFQRYYAFGALAVLVATTLLWSLLGSRLQQTNADQLVNATLFESKDTFSGAILPSQHSMLIKWPLFLLIKAGAYSPLSYQIISVIAALGTVLALAYLLYRIERRPLIFGTLYLGLASVLLMIPAQPYAGALLPVGMAMVTTRNLEYIAYITSIVLLIKVVRWPRRSLLLAISLLALLIASDHLFLTLAIGSGLAMLAVNAFRRDRPGTALAGRWLVAAVAATAISIGLTTLLTATHVLHFAGSGGAAPYSLISTPKEVVLGGIYGASAVVTNLGANPAYDATVVNQALQFAKGHLTGPAVLSYAVNIAVLLLALWASWNVVVRKRKTPAGRVAEVLIWTTVTALIIFVGSKHYYAVDARYLGIAPFAAFMALAVRLRASALQPNSTYAVLAGIILLLSCIAGGYDAVARYHTSSAVQAPYVQYQQKVIQALESHGTRTLLGDYWRVIPLKTASKQAITVLPLQDCVHARQVLTSTHWQPDLNTQRFAYLLSFDKGLTDYPRCTLKDVIAAYGRPNASTLIAGSLEQPQEVVLFYDSGIRAPSSGQMQYRAPSTILPVSLSSLDNTHCPTSTVLNIVAHQDDDLLFLNPDLVHSLRKGDCVRTVYLTAGDSGSGQSYWLAREQGSEAAYASMLGIKDTWVQRIARLGPNQYVSVASPRGNAKISLVFMRLPDGNIDGHGFYKTKHESLARLRYGAVSRIHSVDKQSAFSSKDLRTALGALMQRYQPDSIRTQSNFPGTVFPDHSDHKATGNYTNDAYTDYVMHASSDVLPARISYYMGYPIHELPANVDKQDVAVKEAAFLAYAKFDGGVCHNVLQCSETPTYGSYLTRQYKVER